MPRGLSIAGAVIAAILALGCASPSHRAGATPAQADAIRAALAADDIAGRIRNRQTEVDPPAVVVTDYIAALDAIDLTGTTPRFAHALQAHRDAWAELIGPLRARSSDRAEMHDLFDRLTGPADPMHAEFTRLIDQVWATWAPVEEAARSAGVDP